MFSRHQVDISRRVKVAGFACGKTPSTVVVAALLAQVQNARPRKGCSRQGILRKRAIQAPISVRKPVLHLPSRFGRLRSSNSGFGTELVWPRC